MLRAVLVVALVPILTQASTVYLHPQPPTTAAPSQALAEHLRLEAFFPPAARHHGEVVLGGFVGQGVRDGLLVELDAGNSEDVVPPQLKPSFTLPTSPSFLDEYTRAAQRTYRATITSDGDTPASKDFPRLLDIFALSAAASPAQSAALETFLSRLSALAAFVEDDSAAAPSNRFGAFDVTGLRAVAHAWGRDSAVYRTAASALKATLSAALTTPHTSLAVVLSPRAPLAARAPLPQQSPLPRPPPDTAPVFSTATCFASAAACRNATAACSSRGTCVPASRAGRTCFVCSCGRAPLTEGGKNISWAGEMCQKKDVSQEFALIVGTVLFLLLLVGGSIALLYGIGDETLPGTLTGGVGHHKRD